MDTLTDVKNKIVQVLDCLERIKENAIKILKKLEPVMKDIKDVNNEIVIQGNKKHPEYKINLLQDAMQSITIEWVKDASAVKLEIDKFIKITDVGFIFQSENSCPFLNEVWNGDVYDKFGLEGLQELNKDLEQQFGNINRDNLFALAATKLKK